jgi:hypothetical protein
MIKGFPRGGKLSNRSMATANEPFARLCCTASSAVTRGGERDRRLGQFVLLVERRWPATSLVLRYELTEGWAGPLPLLRNGGDP